MEANVNKHVLSIIIVNIIGTGTILGQTATVSCPQEITMTQLSTLNSTGSLVVGDERFVGEDRENISAITPKSYHPSSFTALAHLRSHEIRDNKLYCNYGYKSTFGNVGSKLSETIQGTPKEELNRTYDYTFTITHQLPDTHHNQEHTTPPPPAEHGSDATTHSEEQAAVPSSNEHHPNTETHHEEHGTAPLPPEHHPEDTTHNDEHRVIAPPAPETHNQNSSVQAYVITKSDVERDTNLKDALETLGLVHNPKITKFIVEKRYKFLLDDAERKSKTATPLDLSKINEAISYVRRYFEGHHNAMLAG